MTAPAWLEPLYARIARLAQAPAYPYLLALALVLCSLFLAWPCITCFDPHSEAWTVIQLKAEHPTHSLEHLDPYTWLAKKVFRISVPVLMRLTHIPPIGIIALQYIFGYALLLYSYKMVARVLRDHVAATFVAAGIVFLYFGRAAFYDITTTWFDGFAYALLVFALYSRRWWVIAFCGFVASWTDERAFIALGIVLIYQHLHAWAGERITLRALLKWEPRSLAVAGAMAAYLALRWTLTALYGMHTPTVGASLDVFQKTLPTMPIGLWTFLEGFWIIWIAVLVMAWRRQEWMVWILVGVPVLLFAVVSGCVTDTTRSGAYMVPLLFLLVRYLAAHMPKKEFYGILFLGFLLTFAFPATIVCADWGIDAWFQWPLPMRLAKRFLGV